MSVPDGDSIIVAGVRVTSPDRVLFSELGLTKEALARYYESVAEWLLPDLRNRPLSLVLHVWGATTRDLANDDPKLFTAAVPPQSDRDWLLLPDIVESEPLHGHLLWISIVDQRTGPHLL